MDTIKSTVGLGEKPEEKAGMEPVSGQQGDESKGEPYDAGNVQGMSLLLIIMSSLPHTFRKIYLMLPFMSIHH